MATDRPVCLASFVHSLRHVRDWQDRPEFGQACDWWRVGGGGILALVGISGAGTTAIADQIVRSLPGVTEAEPHRLQGDTLLLPDGLLDFSFEAAPNPQSFFDIRYDWLVIEFQFIDRRPLAGSGVRTQASASPVINALRHTGRKLLLVLDELEKVQDDASRSGVFGHIEDSGLRAFITRTAAVRS